MKTYGRSVAHARSVIDSCQKRTRAAGLGLLDHRHPSETRVNQRRFAFTALLALIALPIAGVFAADSRDVAAFLRELKLVVMKATGYDNASVELTAGKYMMTVTVINSKLPNSPSRDMEAHKIADALTRVMAAKPEFDTIQALHVDYVAGGEDRDDWRVIDGIDFWKDSKGNFKLHTT